MRAVHRRGWPGIALAGLLAVTSGCAAVLTTLGGPPPVAELPAGCEAAPTPSLRPVRVVVHCHSHRSHDSDGADEEIAAAARATGTEVVLLTDHPIDGGHDAPPPVIDGVLFIPGLELSKRKGAILALGVSGPVDRHVDPAALVRALKARGAVTVLAHAERYRGPDRELSEVDAVEVYNLHADAVNERIPSIALSALFLPPGAFFRSIMDPPLPPVLGRLARLSLTRPRPIVAGNDSHQNVRLFGPLGGAVGTYEETFRVVATYVLVEPGPLTEAGVLEAIRLGRTFVAFEQGASAAGFSFTARAPQGGAAPPGSTVTAVDGLELVAAAPHERAEVSIIRDGFEVARGRQVAAVRDPAPGTYRAEARLDGRTWVVTTGIRVGTGAPEPDASTQAVAPATAGDD